VYLLEEKLREKYGNGFTVFSTDFLDRVRTLDTIRQRRGEVTAYPKGERPVSAAAEQKRLYYLFDASAILHVYMPDEGLTPLLDHFLEQRGLQKAFLYVPNFCVAETFNALARKYYREGELNEEMYRFCKEAFANDIHNGHLFYHLELNRYHVLDVDFIIPFEHLFPTERGDGTERKLSTFDALIIAMGMELSRITGGATYVITCDKRIAEVIRILRKLRKQERERQGVPDYIRFPREIYLYGKRLSELSCVEGQRVG
jgi:hypothetical protein